MLIVYMLSIRASVSDGHWASPKIARVVDIYLDVSYLVLRILFDIQSVPISKKVFWNGRNEDGAKTKCGDRACVLWRASIVSSVRK